MGNPEERGKECLAKPQLLWEPASVMSASVAISEFPFVQELPKRDKGILRTAWDSMRDFRAKQEEVGPLLPFGIAAKLLSVSKQRIEQLVAAGVLEGYVFDGHRMVTLVSIEARARAQRQVGRPKKEAKE